MVVGGDNHNNKASDDGSYFELNFCNLNKKENGFFIDKRRKSTKSDLQLRSSLEQLIHRRSSSIPIQYTNKRRSRTSSPNLSSKHERRRVHSSASCSTSSTTPTFSLSPSSSLIPRKLRKSFSKLISRRSFSIPRSIDRDHDEDNDQDQDQDQGLESSDYDYLDSYHRRESECSIVCPSTEEIVRESLAQGLPIIPFAFPTFLIASKKHEDVKSGIRKNSTERMKKSFTVGDYFREETVEDRSLDSLVTVEDRSLDSVVKLAQLELNRRNLKQVFVLRYSMNILI